MYGPQTRTFILDSVRMPEDGSRSVELSFSSEEPYQRWFGVEILSHKAGDIRTERLEQGVTVLFNHNRDFVIGHTKKAWIGDDLRGHAVIEFDDDDDSERILRKVQSGSLRGVSVGYQIYEFEEVKQGKKSEDGRFDGPCYIARDWEPYEISIVSVPADTSVGVGRSADGEPGQAEGRTLDWFSRQLHININKVEGRV